ncbi:Receptor-like cytosolic serine/threonine-protein kinase RBK2-like protein [Drosera capensis]
MIVAPIEEPSPRAAYEPSSDSDIVSTSDQNHSGTHSSHWRGFIHLLKKGPKHLQSTFHPLTIPKLTRRKSRSARHSVIPAIPVLDSELYCIKSTWKNFTLKELKDLTNDFSRECMIGEGGYAEVYKGVLQSGQYVAIKRLTKGNLEEMAADFLSELGIVVHVNHPNIAKVIGYGVEGGMHLVLHLSPHGSLESLLRGSREKLKWDIRYKIALGSAQGLQYLHEGCQRRIIHRDIKSANILLTEDFEPQTLEDLNDVVIQISDFGLAKWLPENWTHHTVSKIEGTFGYLPPEFFMHGIVDEKTDIYAYGVLLLELISGRLALDDSQKSLVMWAKPFLDKREYKELLDPSLNDAYDMKQLKNISLAASMCIHHCPIERPQMSEVVEILKGERHCSEFARQLRRPTLKRTYSADLFDPEDYNSPKVHNKEERHAYLIGPGSYLEGTTRRPIQSSCQCIHHSRGFMSTAAVIRNSHVEICAASGVSVDGNLTPKAGESPCDAKWHGIDKELGSE